MLPDLFHQVPIDACRHRHSENGDTVFRQDDITRGLYFIQEGKVELRRVTRVGQRVVIHRAKSGETFAEASLFSEHYHCDAIAVSNCHLIELDRLVILKMFNENPKFALAFAKRFAHQNQNYRRKLELFAIRNAEERIFVSIVDGLLAGSVKDFASEIGLTHEVVYRGLATLVEKGALIKTGRGKYLLNPTDPG